MRLRRIDALRYGALENVCLPEIGDGLTIVLGPNESGKSTYTALVRHVLFGFPIGRKTGDRFYRPVGGGERSGRLVFADDTGEWAVERAGEKGGGVRTVRALKGPERPGLVGELVGDLSERTYRIVFGFGLDELDDIQGGDDGYLAQRLYAAGTGSPGANPLSVRATIEKEAADLFSPRARIATVNALSSEAKELKEQIGALEAQAAAFADEQGRADRLSSEAGPLRARRDELDVRVRLLERDAQRARDLSEQIRDISMRVAELEVDGAGLRERIAAAAVDERVAAVAPELTALLDETSGFRQRLEALAASEAAAAEARSRIAELGELPGAADSVESRARADAWIVRRGSLEGEARAAENRAQASEARAREFGAAAGGGAAPARRRPIAGWVAVGLGVAFAIAGFALNQLLAAVFGVVVAVVGGGLLLVPQAAPSEGLGAEAGRTAAEARADRSYADQAADALAREQEAWRAWLAQEHLDAYGDDAASVRTLLDRLRARDELLSAAGHAEAAAARDREAASAWADRLVALVRTFTELPDAIGLDEVAGVAAARARESLDAVRAAQETGARASEALTGTSAEFDRAAGRLAGREADFAAILATHGLDADSAVPRIEAARAEAAEELAEVRDLYEQRASELSELRGRLDSEGRDAAMALARQRLEGLRARIQTAADAHLTSALAVRLLDRARERFERERQPEVTRVAGRVFAQMTGGAYTDVRVPLDGGDVSVMTRSGALRPSSELSRGAAEQLYLALRVGFLASLPTGRDLPVLMDDIAVNYDASRRDGAAAAIAELAKDRQVIYFTCHEDTAAALADAFPGHALVTLDRCVL